MHWYAVMVNDEEMFLRGRAGHREFAAVKRMKAERYDAFTPCLHESFRESRGARRNRRIAIPMFAGYCFGRLDERGLQRLKVWPEILDVVRIGRDPYILTDGAIEAVRSVERAMDKLEITADPAAVLEQALGIGDEVALKDPLWHGHVGVISEIHGEYVVALLKLLGNETRVKVGRNKVVAQRA